MPGIAPIALGPDIAGSMGAGLEQVEPEQLALEAQKQQVQAGKMQLAAAANQQQQQAQSQMDSQAAFLARMGRANPGGETNPQIAQQLDAWATKRGLPSPVQRNAADGSFKIDFDMVPGSGGINDMKPEDKARAMALPEAERRLEFPGQSEQFYKADPYISDPKEQDSMRQEWTKLVQGFGSGATTPLEAMLWLKTTPGAQSVVSVPTAVDMLKDPQFQAQTLGPLARANISKISSVAVSDKAKANYERLLTQYLPQLTAARITHMHDQDATAAQNAATRGIVAQADVQRANGYITSINNNAPLITARIGELNALSTKTKQYISDHNTTLATAGVTALGRQSTTVKSMLDSLTKQYNALLNVTSPSEDQITQMQVLGEQIQGLNTQLQGIQSDQGMYADAIRTELSNKLGKGSGKPFTFQKKDPGTQYTKGQSVPGIPDAKFTGEKRGEYWIFTDKDGKLKGFNPNA